MRNGNNKKLHNTIKPAKHMPNIIHMTAKNTLCIIPGFIRFKEALCDILFVLLRFTGAIVKYKPNNKMQKVLINQ